MPSHGPNVIFRDKLGRFVAYKDRYDASKVAMVERWDPYIQLHRPVADRMLPPMDLATLLPGQYFDVLPPAFVKMQEYKSTSQYKAWDIAQQIDQTQGVRRKQLRVTMEIIDGKRKRTITFYQKIKSNAESSYHIFRRMNSALGFENMHLYKTAGGKVIADRRGRKVSLSKVIVEEVL